MEHKVLIELGACAGARAWASNYPTLRDAWFACDRGDWMLWLIAHTLPRERLVWVACQIARTALGYVPVEEERPRAAIESAEAWTRGEATLVKVARDAYAARDSARDATLDASAYATLDASASAAYAAAAYAAAYATYSAYSTAAYAARAATSAAAAAASAAATSAAYAAAAAADAADAATSAADALRIIRREIAWEEIEAALPA